MKKKTALILSSIFVSLLFIVAPLQSPTSAQTSDETTQATYTRTVTKTEIYGLNDAIKPSILYNSGGWKGTLYLQSTQSTGNHILAVYRGTVSCSGTCPIPAKSDEQS